MYLYIYIHTHTHTHIYIYKLYAHTCIYYTYTYIYTHTHAHTSIYVHVHTRIAVHVYITFRLLMEGGMVRVYRILRVMPQPAINIAKICFVTNYGKSRNYNFVPLAWGYLWATERRASGCSYFPPSNYSGNY